jgi:uncharacterized protein (TIGR00255 family)
MTGYGRGEALLYDRRFIVEIKSVNHRYNDMTIKIPRALLMYEDKLKKLLTSDIFRGKTDVYVSFESYSAEDVRVKINEPLADSFYEALGTLKEKYSIKDDVSLSLMARFPDLITVEKNTVSESEHDEIWECLEAAASQALANFVAMRETEGEALKNDILRKLDGIEQSVKRVAERAPLVAADYRQRLIDRLSEIKELDVDESRLVTEVAIFADKACIDEEITRMFSHISQMRTILTETTPVGRKLDFLIQEMNREVNTMGSKSNDLEITNIIVDTKSEIEKIREQIQNFE